MDKKNNLYVMIAISCITVAIIIGCNKRTNSEIQSNNKVIKEVREPAVSGAFYPADPQILKKSVVKHLDQAKVDSPEKIRGLVVPHAGYIYSGPTAAFSYKTIQGRQYDTVIVIGSNHRDRTFRGASIPNVKNYRTPLGLVELSPLAHKLREKGIFSSHASAHAREHSIEVQLPFLQTVLKDFKFVPILLSFVNPRKIADELLPFINERTLVVASSDLSHYHPYNTAVKKDKQTTDAIVSLDIARMHMCEACGSEPVLVLMHLAKMLGWKTKLLDYSNSGDTAGDKSRVVGYCAIAFYGGKVSEVQKSEAKKVFSELKADQQNYLLGLARKTLAGYFKKDLPQPDEKSLDPRLVEPQACFVTLTKHGQLRGCIGNFSPEQPLYKTVMDNALSAALRDQRFPALTKKELTEVKIEISALSPMKELEFSSPDDLLKKLRPNIDGVVLVQGHRRSTFLPQVWEQLPNKEKFLERLSMKAGLSPQGWKSPETVILIYTVQAFEEHD